MIEGTSSTRRVVLNITFKRHDYLIQKQKRTLFPRSCKSHQWQTKLHEFWGGRLCWYTDVAELTPKISHVTSWSNRDFVDFWVRGFDSSPAFLFLSGELQTSALVLAKMIPHCVGNLVIFQIKNSRLLISWSQYGTYDRKILTRDFVIQKIARKPLSHVSSTAHLSSIMIAPPSQ